MLARSTTRSRKPEQPSIGHILAFEWCTVVLPELKAKSLQFRNNRSFSATEVVVV